MLKISMQMMGCGERSKFATKNSKNTGSSSKLRIFGVRERMEEEVPGKEAWGAQAPCGRGQGPGRATWPPGPGVAPPGQPQVPLCHSSGGNFYSKFSGIFLTTSLLNIFQCTESCKTSGRLETMVKHMKFQKHKLWYSKENKS